jgi:flagellar hook-associated protein 2
MSGITSGTGVFSGIDTRSIIDQLIAVESRPKVLAQGRVVQLKQQQAAVLDLNSRLSALKTAAAKFRVETIFKAKRSVSSNENVLSATVSNTAAAGSYSLRVGRLVSSQQQVSRGFADQDTSGLNLTSVKVESAAARLDTDVSLADFNGGAGVRRGKIVVTDGAGGTATVDLSRATTVNDVLDAINSNGTARVAASVVGGRFVLKSTVAGNVTVANGAGSTTATSLGIEGTAATTLTGQVVYGLNANTSLASLNDGNGVNVRFNATSTVWSSLAINVNGTRVEVNLADVYVNEPGPNGTQVAKKSKSGVSTVGGVITRMNEALTAAGFTGVRAQINAEQGRVEIVDQAGTATITVEETTLAGGGSTAKDLGLLTAPAGSTVNGRRILAGANSVLTQSLNGGTGISGDGQLNFTLRDGTVFSLNASASSSLTDLMAAIQTASGTTAGGLAKLGVTLDSKGTGITLRDNTGGVGNLIITGTSGQDSAASLGISTGATGVAAAVKESGNLQKQYVSTARTLASYNNGRGVGIGKFIITDSSGANATIDIAADSRTLDDVIREINATNISVEARINQTGDGVELADTGTGTLRMRVVDEEGLVAKNLGIAGTATGSGAGPTNNFLNGTLEKTVKLDVGDSLDAVARKINEAGVGVSASVIRDGAGSTPFRLSLTSLGSGRSGRFIFDSGAVDLGFTSLSNGEDALVFLGAGDVANAIAATSSSNLVDGLLPGVKIDLKGISNDPVSLNVTGDNDKILGAANEFIEAFNDLVGRIDTQTRYDKETKKGGPLLGDGSIFELRSSIFRAIQAPALGVSSQYRRLTDVGVRVGKEGKLELNQDKFLQALATDAQGVEALFAARTAVADAQVEIQPGVFANNPNAGSTFSSQGVMTQLEQMADRYVNSVTGVLTSRNRGFDEQIAAQNSRIENFDTRLETRRLILERQFASMEKVIGKLQSQGASLGSIGAVRR